LEEKLPLRKDKILNRIREMRDGKLYNPNFGERMRGKGEHWHLITDLFKLSCQRYGLNTNPPEKKENPFRRPSNQGRLFD
jgi:DNA repair photolyase